MLWNAGLSTYHAGVEWKFWPGPTDCSGPINSLGSAGNMLKQFRTSESCAATRRPGVSSASRSLAMTCWCRCFSRASLPGAPRPRSRGRAGWLEYLRRSLIMEVLIIGAGIGGLTLGLMLHRAGIACRIFEAAPELKAVGVGINMLPHASRELIALGLEEALAKVAVTTREYCFYNRFGQFIYSEPAGRFAGYDVPQFSIHRGDLQMVLLDAFIARAGADKVDHRLALHARRSDGPAAVAHFEDGDGKPLAVPARQRRGQRRRHPFGAAQAALSERRAAEIFRHQHVARRHALAAVPVRRQHGARRLASSGQAADLSDPQQYRRRRPAARELGGATSRRRSTSARDWNRRGRLEDFMPCDGGLAIRLARRAAIHPQLRPRSWNIRWSIRIRCRAGASAA